jgi:hypothetical protein
MAWKAVTTEGAYCSACGAQLDDDAGACSLCKAPFSKTANAVICKICGCFTPSTHSRCNSCGIQIGVIEVEDVEVSEEDLPTIINRIVEQESRPEQRGEPDDETKEEELDIDIASILYQELISSLEKLEKLSEDLYALDRLPDWRKIQKINRFWAKFKVIVEGLRETHKVLDSFQGKVFFEGGKLSALERSKMREERLVEEIYQLRKELIAREVALLMADDEFLTGLSKDMSHVDRGNDKPIDREEMQRVLATIDRLIASLPKGVLAQFAHSKEYISFEKLLAKYGI